MAQRGIEVIVAIILPDGPGTSFREVYDPDITPGLLSYGVAARVQKAVKKLRKPKKAPEA